MKLRLFLADAAEVREQLLFVLGGGWAQVGPQPQPFALVGIIEVTWEETNRQRRLVILIEDEDGQQPFKIEASFDVGRPVGPPGRSFNLPIAVNVTPLPWIPGRRYIVKGVVDGETLDQVAFEVRPQPKAKPGEGS